VATVHLLTAGTDSADVLSDGIAIAVGVAAVFVGALLLTWRSAPRTRRQLASTDGVEHP
jgi:hypothetical protein